MENHEQKELYLITIKKIGEKEVQEESWERMYDSDHPQAKETDKPQYDNVVINKTVKTEELVYEQRKTELDLEEVIKAVNNIE